jgi:hypothetical protein
MKNNAAASDEPPSKIRQRRLSVIIKYEDFLNHRLHRLHRFRFRQGPSSNLCNLCNLWFHLLCLLFVVSGCRSQSPRADSDVEQQAIALAVASGLNPPQRNVDVQAKVVPPVGWNAEPLKRSDNHAHQVWISPGGSTAYGIIYFNLPLPVGPDLTLWGFMQQMQRVEGRATLISRQNDNALPGLRFVAEGAIYTVRVNLIVGGFHGWAVYAGTLNQKPVNRDELVLAIRAREQTRVGLP